MVLRPARVRARAVAASMSRAPTGSRATASASPPGGTMPGLPWRASAAAASGVPASVARAVKPAPRSVREIAAECRLAAEEMGAAGDVEDEAVRPVEGDERRVAVGGVGQALQQAEVRRRVVVEGDEMGHAGPASASFCPARGPARAPPGPPRRRAGRPPPSRRGRAARQPARRRGMGCGSTAGAAVRSAGRGARRPGSAVRSRKRPCSRSHSMDQSRGGMPARWRSRVTEKAGRPGRPPSAASEARPRTRQRERAAEGSGSAPARVISTVTPLSAAASDRRRLAVRSRIFGAPQISATTAPTAPQRAASSVAFSASSASARAPARRARDRGRGRRSRGHRAGRIPGR